MFKNTNGSLLLQAASFIFPRKCVACGEYLVNLEEFLCKKCAERVERTKAPFCEFCGVGKDYCRCRKNRHAYETVIAPFYYEGAIKDAIGRMKFGKKEGVASFFGQEMTKDIMAKYFGIKFDILTCVPSTNKSIKERGFNQSRSILEEININGVEKDYDLLIKRNQKDIQHTLGAEKRRKNTDNVYFLKNGKDVKNKIILLVDDILTTGATADSCAKTLRLSGAQKVYVSVAALDILHND
ncbi:MAG: ComF family protein [Oscillospiraceae bacterium]|nr:ComF family protein [Oscillospiraceae bacterium]